jgi:SAM-dependent methyltransferase
LNYVAALNGVAPRKLDQPFTYLELGCGTGCSTVTHAAAFSHGEFHACDFNPNAIAAGAERARTLAATNVRFHEASFEALATRKLPPFDFIVLHGVYSWVGEEARQSICRLIRRHLAPGGLVYVSYNCLPGWSGEMPLRRLMMGLSKSGAGDSLQRVQHGIHALKYLSHVGLEYFRANPAAATAVDAYSRSPGSYLAHEFLDPACAPRYSVDVADEMSAAGLRYAGSATLVDNHQALLVDDQTACAVAGLECAGQQHLAMDFAMNRQFRRDVFVQESDTQPEAGAHLGNIVIGSPGNPKTINATVQVPRGKISFHTDFIDALRVLMSRGPVMLCEATAGLSGKTRHAGETARNLLFLIAAGELAPFAKALNVFEMRCATRFASAAVERAILHVADAGSPEVVIPSEVAGWGVPISRREAVAVGDYLAGAAGGAGHPETLARLSRLGVVG